MNRKVINFVVYKNANVILVFLLMTVTVYLIEISKPLYFFSMSNKLIYTNLKVYLFLNNQTPHPMHGGLVCRRLGGECV